jgi:hypothetical protein
MRCSLQYSEEGSRVREAHGPPLGAQLPASLAPLCQTACDSPAASLGKYSQLALYPQRYVKGRLAVDSASEVARGENE